MRALLLSLGDFVGAGLRPRTPLAKAIVFILLIKLVGIVSIKMFMFADSAQPIVDADAVARAIGVSQSQH